MSINTVNIVVNVNTIFFIVVLLYTFRYFLIDIVLPKAPIPIPSTKYTITSNVDISAKLSNGIPIFASTAEFPSLLIIKLYAYPRTAREIIAAIIPMIIPSIMNGHLIKLSVAPTYFIIDISFLLA